MLFYKSRPSLDGGLEEWSLLISVLCTSGCSKALTTLPAALPLEAVHFVCQCKHPNPHTGKKSLQLSKTFNSNFGSRYEPPSNMKNSMTILTQPIGYFMGSISCSHEISGSGIHVLWMAAVVSSSEYPCTRPTIRLRWDMVRRIPF